MKVITIKRNIRSFIERPNHKPEHLIHCSTNCDVKAASSVYKMGGAAADARAQYISSITDVYT